MNLSIEKKKKIRKTIYLVVTFLLLVGMLVFLQSIRYRVKSFFSYGIITWDDHISKSSFKEHQSEFDLTVTEINDFMDQNQELVEKYDITCSVYQARIGFHFKLIEDRDNSDLEIDEKGRVIIPEPIYRPINEDASLLWSAFPEKAMSVEGGAIIVRPEYIKFRERTCCVVYSRNGKRPDILIEQYWKEHEWVQVEKLDECWYEVDCYG